MMFKSGKDNGHDTWKIISKYISSLFPITYVVGTHWGCAGWYETLLFTYNKFKFSRDASHDVA